MPDADPERTTPESTDPDAGRDEGESPTATEAPVEIDAGGHLVVVGYDAWTEPVLEELATRDVSVALVATDPALRERLADRPLDLVVTDDIDEACFEAAGIGRADAVLVATLDDQRNVLAVLTVRNVDPSVRIATFAGEARDVPKLRAAGADRVISLGEAVAELLAEVSLSDREVADVVAEIAAGD